MPAAILRLWPYWLLASLLTAAFGATLSEYLPGLNPEQGAIQMLLMAGTGWWLILGGACLRIPSWKAYWEQLSKIMLTGVAILVPYILLQLLVGNLPWWLAAVSVLLSSLMMLGFHLLAVRRLSISPRWNWAWFLTLQTTAVFWIWVFHF